MRPAIMQRRESPLTLFQNPFFFSPSEEDEASVVDCRFITLISPFSFAGIKSTNFPVVGIKDLEKGTCTRGTVATRVVDGTNASSDGGLNTTSKVASRAVLVFIMVRKCYFVDPKLRIEILE